MILNNKSSDELRTAAQKKGMVTLRDAGMSFVFNGTTTLDEVIRETILEA